jgi:hypothetical protein
MDWLRYSGMWITLVVNPLHWRFSFSFKSDDVYLSPNLKEISTQLAFLSLRLVIDNGDW